MTHTPGPWTVFNGHVHAGGFEYLPTHRSGAPETEWEANARLIAAAPELLAALKGMVREISKYHDTFDANLFVAAERAIAKAEGSG
jgi:hypothetical protein